MVQINFARREVNCKIVYYGPGMSGKTTNLEIIHNKVPKENRGDMTSIATEGERTLFFDFLPLELGKVSGMDTKFKIYTVPGQIYYNSTRKLVLQGVDGVVFVADSQASKRAENIESLDNLRENLEVYNIDMYDIPLVLQYNKRDLTDILTIEDLEKDLNCKNITYCEAVAVNGEGVIKTLKEITSLTLEQLNRKVIGGASTKPSTPKKAAPKITSKPVKKKAPVTVDDSNSIIGTIDGEEISKADYNNFCSLQVRVSARGDAEIAKIGEGISEKDKKKYLDFFVNHTVVLNEAKKKNIVATPDEITAQLKSFAAKNGSEEKFLKFLRSRGLEMVDIESEAIRNILTIKLVRTVIPDFKNSLSVGNEELKDYFEQNKSDFNSDFESSKEKVLFVLRKKKKKDLLNSFYSAIKDGKQIKMNL